MINGQGETWNLYPGFYYIKLGYTWDYIKAAAFPANFLSSGAWNIIY